MLIKELPALAGDATTIVWAGGDKADDLLPSLFPGQDDIPRLPYDPDDTGTLDAKTLLIAFAGPDSDAHLSPEALSAALRRLAPDGRVLMLLGWPVEQLPYHVLLGPLVDAGCQVLQAVPVDKAVRHGVHCAVVAARVSRLAPLRTYLDDSPVSLTGAEPDLRTLLRLAGEYTFGDLVARPMRRRLAELDERDAAQKQRIRQLEKDVKARDAQLTAAQKGLANAQARLARVESSTTYQVGHAMVQGARRPGRAIVSVPVGLVRVWRNRGSERG
jgi:uncharacterized coiled-coil protein SlyX